MVRNSANASPATISPLSTSLSSALRRNVSNAGTEESRVVTLVAPAFAAITLKAPV